MKFSIIKFVSPNLYIAIVATVAALCMVENPLGGLSIYTGFEGISYKIFAVFFVALLLGSLFSHFFFKSVNVEPVYKFNSRYLVFLFFVSVSFQLIKFANIGDVPLIGDPFSRYRLTIGGLEDFPSRLLAPLGICFYYLSLAKKNRFLYFGLSCICLLLNLLMMQRQEVLVQLLGMLIIKTRRSEFGLVKFFTLSLLGLLLIFFVVGFGAILRYGSAEISSHIFGIQLLIWIIHLEAVGAYVFGEHVISLMTEHYYGVYTFGDYLSLLGFSGGAHGASLLGQIFTDRDTAQSIGAPYSYYLDFGFIGLFVIGGIIGGILRFFYNKAIVEKNTAVFTVLYLFLIISSLWSVRSGIFIVNALNLYIIIAIFSCTSGGSKSVIMFKNSLRFALLFTIFLSYSAAVIRA